jgi:hypothetical protein
MSYNALFVLADAAEPFDERDFERPRVFSAPYVLWWWEREGVTRSLREWERQFDRIVPPSRRIELHGSRLASPGFFDFLGDTFSLRAINDYLDGRQRRKEAKATAKTRAEREEILNRKLEYEVVTAGLEAVGKGLDVADRLGWTPERKEAFVAGLVAGPLDRLGRHQDVGMIEGAEIVKPEGPDGADEEASD